jgi:AsmA protein
MLKRRRTEQDEMLFGGVAAPTPPAALKPSVEVRKRRRRRRGSFLRQLGAVAGLAVLGYVALPFVLNGSRMLPIAEATLSENLGRRVRIGSLRFSPTFGTLIATDVAIADDPAFSSAPCVYAQRVELAVRRIPLIFQRALEITGVSLEEPTVTLIHNAAQWNFYGVLAAGPVAPATTPGPSLSVRGGILVVRGSDRAEPLVLRDINLEAPRFSTALANTLALTSNVGGGGTVKLNGTWGPVRWSGKSPTIPMNMLVNAKAVALAESNLAAGVAPAIGGLFSLDGTIESDGSSVQVKGNAELDKLKLSASGAANPEPLMFVFSLTHDLATRAGRLERGDLTLKKGSASVTGSYSMGNRTEVKLQATGQGVPVTPLAGLLPAAGLPFPPGSSLQGGVGFVQLAIEGDLNGPTTTGTVSLSNTKLMSFDLEERLANIAGLDLLHINRDIAIDEWRATVHISPQAIAFTELEINVPEIGIFTGRGGIDANRTLDFQMSALRNGVSDKQPIPFVVRGACISPIFRQPGKGA